MFMNDVVLIAVLSHLAYEQLILVSITCQRIRRLCVEIVGNDESQVREQQHFAALVQGSWPVHGYRAASERSKKPSSASGGRIKVEFSAFFVPGAEVAQAAHALVTDGAQLLVTDGQWGMLKALCPPNFPPSPHRQAAPVPNPVPISSLPNFTTLRLLALQPLVTPFPPGSSSASSSTAGSSSAVGRGGSSGVRQYAGSTREGTGCPAWPEPWPWPAHHLPSLPLKSSMLAGGQAAVLVPCAPHGFIPATGNVGPGNSRLGGGLGVGAALGSSRIGGGGSSSSSGSSGSSTGTWPSEACVASSQLALDLLAAAPCLPSTTYLDLSWNVLLRDGDVCALVRRARPLMHLAAAGAALGGATLMLLGTQGRLRLRSLDVSFNPHCPVRHALPAAKQAGSREAPGSGHASHPSPPPPTASAFMRLLRAALGRLPELTDLRLAGNDLTGLLVPVTPVTSAPSHTGGPPSDALSDTTDSTPATHPSGSSCLRLPDTVPGVVPAGGPSLNSQPPSQACSRPAAALLEAPLACTLARLTRLDLAHCSGLGPKQLALILTACTSLQNLDVHGCRGLSGWSDKSSGDGRGEGEKEGGGVAEQDTDTAAVLLEQGGEEVRCERGVLPGAIPRLPEAGSSTAVTQQEALQHVAGHAEAVQYRAVRHRAVHQKAVHGAVVQRMPRLRRLCGGWGMSARLLHMLIEAAGPQLQVLDLHVGAGVSDDVLLHVAAACPTLRELRLTLAPVSDIGVRSVLSACMQLHVLHLVQCAGPFTSAMLAPSSHPAPASAASQLNSGAEAAGRDTTQQPSTTSGSPEAAGQAASDAAAPAVAGTAGHTHHHRWTLSSLTLTGGPLGLRDADVIALIGRRPHTLHTLSLSNAHALTPGLLAWLGRTHGASMRHLSLQQCGGGAPGALQAVQGAVQAVQAVQSAVQAVQSAVTQVATTPRFALIPDVAVAAAPAPAVAAVASSPAAAAVAAVAQTSAALPPAAAWKMSEAALLQLLAACPDLASLRLRHCCEVSAGFVEEVRCRCVALTSLVVDSCDLSEGGLRLTCDPHGALTRVMVARCRAVQAGMALQPLDLGSDAPDSTGSTGGTGGAGSTQRMVDKDVLIHELQLGRSHSVAVVPRA